MTWLLPGLGVVLLVVVLATIIRATPPDGRSVGGTRLMTVARVVLVIIAGALIASVLI